MNARAWWGTDPAGRRHRALRLITTRGVLPVQVCQRCAALVLRAGIAQHERHHHAGPRDTA